MRVPDGDVRMMRLRLGERFLQQLPLAEIHCPITANCVLSSRQDGCLSALPPKADMCAAEADVRQVPKADMAASVDGFIGASK